MAMEIVRAEEEEEKKKTEVAKEKPEVPKQEIPLSIGLTGVSLEAISQDDWGYCKFPVGPKDERFKGGRVWVPVKVVAIEPVRERREVTVYDDQKGIKEATPVELSYELAEGGYQRAGEDHPLPVTAGSKVVNYVTKEATTSGNTAIVAPSNGKKIRVHYFSISNKHTVLADVGMRFGTSGTITHKFGLAAGGGTVTANLLDACWEGAVDETLYAYLAAAYANGVYFTVGYTEE